MPYILAPIIRKDVPGLWAEGDVYESDLIYDICSPDASKPPVRYSAHTLKPHSICHFDAPAHIIPSGDTIDALFERPEIFFGPVSVIRLRGNRFIPPKGVGPAHWEVSREELEEALSIYRVDEVSKLFLGFEGVGPDFYRDPSFTFTLSPEAASFLVSLPRFNLFGTVWKSVDYRPGSRERPIHRILFSKAGILECLDLSKVPEGRYFLSAFPMPMEGATESPVCPVLFREDELSMGS